MVVDQELVSGILGIRLEPFDNAKPGDTNTVTVEVTRPNSNPLTSEFKVKCIEEPEPPTQKKPDPDKEPDKESELLKAVGKPDIQLVEREEWGDEFNEEVIVHIEGQDPRDFTYYVNVDAAPIESFRERKNLNDAGIEIINEQWAAIVFYMTLGSYMKWAVAIDQKLRENGRSFLDDELLPDTPEQQEEDPLMPSEDDVEQVVDGLNVPTIDQIDPRQMAAASVAGSVQTLLDWRYADDDLEGLTE